jgi:uncharacterized protein YjiK
MLYTLLIAAISFILTVFGCISGNTKTENLTKYDLTTPDAIFVLPDTLREVSGLTYLDTERFACIQDENGILFIYNVLKNKLEGQYTFHFDGDYEGIARVNKTIYVLRSDGTLFEIPDYESKDFRMNAYVTGIPANNNEGLCYDPDYKRLLIASKGKIGKGSEYKDKRVIYGFDLNTKTLTKDPLFDFNLQAIKQFALHHKINLPAKTKKKGKKTEPEIKFRTSAISIHPLTNRLYLLSASDHLLFIFNMDGKLEHIEPLNPKIFNKAEGITFFENGDMFITNEGQDKRPTLLRFNYKEK